MLQRLSHTTQVTRAKKSVKPDASKNWLPTSEWAGRLILPKPSERKEGGVYFEVRQAPAGQEKLKGKKVWLNFEKAEWVDRVTRDINFSKKTDKSQASGHQHPERLDGAKNVSPLETLAGTRQGNDMIVTLEDVKLSDKGMTITKEPVQVAGTQKALVTFEKKIDAHTWQVRHWNKETSDFTGPKEVIKTDGRDDLAPMENKRTNSKGFYLYGDQGKDGKVHVKSLEPRELLQVSSDQVMLGEDESLDYVGNKNWNAQLLEKGEMTKTVLDPTRESGAKLDTVSAEAKKLFKLGEKALLVHLFGGAQGAPMMMGIFAGHFAFGIAEVVQDEFTGEERFDIEYKQIYAHNRGGIVSGSQKWNAYMGETTRGLYYDRPVSDSIIKMPELFDDSQGEAPVEAFEQRLQEMTARYRAGEGDGSSQVTSAQNCSQDSSQALYATMADWKKSVKKGSMSPALLEISNKLAKHITPFFGIAPRAWKKTARNERSNPKSLRWLPALKVPNTVLPRANADGLTEMAIKADKPVMIIKTDVVGADNPGVDPLPPLRNLIPFDGR